MRAGRREQATALRRNGGTEERRDVGDVAPYGGEGERRSGGAEERRGVGDVGRREQAPALRRNGK